jgi:glycosyltransferase involved in cell wall biosynthesis
MPTQAIYTIVSNNYLHYARTLMQSVASYHPEAKRYCVIVDTDLEPAEALSDEFETLQLSQIGLPFGDEFMFQYSILELNTAVKPWAMQYLLDQGHDKVIYIDPDIYLYQPLSEVMELLDAGAAIVLTPHLLAPMTDDFNPNELAIRIAGTYNLGFCAVSNRDTTRAFLKWWQAKLERNCIIDFPNGVFVDQSWVDLVPGLFNKVAILRHPGYNVAYWNLAQRNITGESGHLQVNGHPLVFFHFSGVDPQEPKKISKHQNRHSLDTVSVTVYTLFSKYCETVLNNDMAIYRACTYGFASFEDGTPITQAMRTRFRLSSELRSKIGASPFDQANAFSQSTAITTSPRLHEVYHYFLDRGPDPTALQNFARACDTWPGFLRLAIGVGRSAESRRNLDWKRRLLLWPLWQLFQALFPDDHAKSALTGSVLAPTNMHAKIPAPASTEVGINLIGYIAAELGIGEAARSLARACNAVGVPYSVVDVGYQSANLQRDTQALANACTTRFAIDMVYVNADQTETTLQYLQKKGLESAYKIGFWHWEQPVLPAAHLASFKHLDEVWVPSAFVHQAVAAVSPVPVMIIPHAMQVRATPGVNRSEFGLPDNKILALVMYDFFSYQHRKNPQAAIAAFRKAVEGRTDAVLVIKTINGNHQPQALAELESHLAGLSGTIIIKEFLTRQQSWDLQSCCDMLISLHRAEGFGLVPAEMMALGKPVVATGWSANMDFMTAENSMPVKYTLEPLAETVGAYPAGPLWAEADINHAAACIRQLIDQPALRKRLGEQAARDIKEKLDPKIVGTIVSDRLKAIVKWHPELVASREEE